MAQKKKINFNWFTAAVAVLAVLIAILAIVAFSKIFSGYSEYTNGPDSILNSARRHDYDSAVGEALHDRALGKNGEDYKVSYAAVDYLNAEVLYVAYQAAGDEDTAAGYKAKMDTARKDMGEVAKTICTDIDSMLDN
ncbi:MAG: hypothetical protein II473_01720 [Clostridia bacterium]|nr:hypothetical protein [Clostridia bacterium]